MKTWIAILALMSASSCRDARAQPEAKTTTSSKWKLAMKDGAISKIVVAPDGDVIAGGPIKGTVEIAGQKLQSKDSGVWIARIASSGALRWAKLVDPKKLASQYLQALSVASDGSILVDINQREAPYLRRVSITADGSAQTVDALVPETRTMASVLMANGDAIVSAEAGKGDTCKGAVVQRVKPGGKRAWSVCNAKVDLGAASPMDVAADGRSAMCAHEWIAGFSPAGKRTWEGKHPKGLWCEELAIAPSGEVIAVYDGPPAPSVTQWKANGKAGWTTPCATIVKGAGNCLLEALALRGADVVVSGRTSEASVIAVLDARTGAVKKTYPLAIDAAFEALAVTDSSIVFGTTGGTGATIELLGR